MNYKQRLKERHEDLNYAIEKTQMLLKNCIDPDLKQMYSDSIHYYTKQLEKVEQQILLNME